MPSLRSNKARCRYETCMLLSAGVQTRVADTTETEQREANFLQYTRIELYSAGIRWGQTMPSREQKGEIAGYISPTEGSILTEQR